MGELEAWIESGGPAVGFVPNGGWPWMAEALSVLGSRAPAPWAGDLWRIDESGGLSPQPPGLSPEAAVFSCGLSQVPLRTLWRLRRLGCGRFYFPAKARWVRKDSLSAFRAAYFRHVAHRLARAFPGPFSSTLLGDVRAEQTFVRWGRPAPDDSEGPLTWAEFLEFDNRLMKSEAARPDGPYRVALYIGSLGPGGAERQFCNLANGLARRGHQVTTVVAHRLSGPSSHYAALLEDLQLQPMVGDDTPRDEEVDGDLLLESPPELRDAILRLVGVLRRRRPEILHAWLDQCNLIGGIAGLLAGVPRILLSTRNSNPTNFPRLLAPYMEEWYRVLSRSHRVRLLANSRSGALSYADWLGLPEERIHVVLNGFEEGDFEEASTLDRAAVRADLGIPQDAPVLLGVFRLDIEKQPDLFLEVARRVAEKVGGLRVLIAGTGPLQAEMESFVNRSGLSGRVIFLGRRSDISRILSASDVLLLTSTLEGSPNAVIEASHFGVPVVATAGGGTADAVLHGETGFLAGIRDADALSESVLALLNDSDLRARMREAGPRFIASAFSPAETVDITVEAYDRLFHDDPLHPTRVVSRRFRKPA